MSKKRYGKDNTICAITEAELYLYIHRPSQLVAAFGQKYGNHFLPDKVACPSLSNKEAHDSEMEWDLGLEQEDLDLTPTAERPQMEFIQERAVLTAESDFKSKQSRLSS